ncbi:hypothetical protein HU200_059441 [Digitaria exilis]|uniref:Uncharacterized protein n=1 Tax=Digitaria exilis TaxID=1010633 RepID=A0A835DYF0_9POAL|nr:hypothetical protein HU200_059441 [Digitaria exilis]
MSGAAMVRLKPRKRPRLGPQEWPSSPSPASQLPLDLRHSCAAPRRAVQGRPPQRRRWQESFHWRRLHHGDRFVRGHLVRDKDEEIFKHVAANAAWDDDKTFALPGRPLATCDGLILVCVTTYHQRHYEELRAYSSATGMLLVVGDVHNGGGAIGRSFKVRGRWAPVSRSRSPVVLVADVLKISVWSRSEGTGKWRRRPQMVMSYAAITGRSRRVVDDLDGNVELRWFGTRSGAVLIRVPSRGEFWWLDLRTKEVIKTPTGYSLDTEYYFVGLGSNFS